MQPFVFTTAPCLSSAGSDFFFIFFLLGDGFHMNSHLSFNGCSCDVVGGIYCQIVTPTGEMKDCLHLTRISPEKTPCGRKNIYFRGKCPDMMILHLTYASIILPFSKATHQVFSL